MEPALLTAIGAIITAFGGAAVAVYTAIHSARQTELTTLRVRVDNLTKANEHLHRENTGLREYIALLRSVLRKHGIEVPALAAIEDDWEMSNGGKGGE